MWFENGLDKPNCDCSYLFKTVISQSQDNDIFVEVGSFVGENTAFIVDTCREMNKNLKVYCVDRFDAETLALEANESMDEPINAKKLTMRQWIGQYGSHCILTEFFLNLHYKERAKYLSGVLVMNSWKAANLFTDKSIVCAYIDAGHSYEAVSEDLKAWFPKIREGGVIAGHDWFSGEGVRRAVSEFSAKNNLKLIVVESSWVLSNEK